MFEVNIKKFTVSMESWCLVILGWSVEENEGNRLLQVTWSELHAGTAVFCQVSETLRATLWSSNLIMMVNREV